MRTEASMVLAWLSAQLHLAAASAPALPAPASVSVDFARHIQPIFAEHCYSCHGAERQKNGLRLDQKETALQGGDSGRAILPGKSIESLLIRNVSSLDPDTRMPPPKSGNRPLNADEIALLRAWIDQGAPWPEDKLEAFPRAGTRLEALRHWAFQPASHQSLPALKNSKWARNAIDTFILSKLERDDISPSPEADRNTLIRRLSLDLLGLPPTPEEVRMFLRDQQPDAYERLVDRLLASPHFGEQWGRHWLDLARYADSDGYEKDGIRPYAYLYRDWVIEAINRDLPFDQFTVEQIAGDLLPDATLAQKTATGFHRQTLTNKEGGVDAEEFRCKANVDRASTTATVWLGLTVGCAECHSHKYDPITQREFYQFYAFFNQAVEQDIAAPSREELVRYNEEKLQWNEQYARLQGDLDDYLKNDFVTALYDWMQSEKGPLERLGLPTGAFNLLAGLAEQRNEEERHLLAKHFRKIDPQARQLERRLEAHAKKQPKFPETKAATITENGTPPKTHIHVRGDFLRQGDQVQPGTFAVLHPLQARSSRPDRLDLARWLVAAANPLTARVTVNHVWRHLFGRGLVTTENDFGTRGDPPSHPELLDWLALKFMSPPDEEPGCGWSRKSLIRLIVTSAAYRQSSIYRQDLSDRDPGNTLLARQNRFRLSAENVRDVFLAASGLLNRQVGGPSIRPPLPADIAALGYAGSVKWQESEGAARYRRGLYVFFQRTVPYPMLTIFDAPDSNVTCTRRERSNTPLQALTLWNDPVFFECARALGERLDEVSTADVKEKIEFGFETCFSRQPTLAELNRLKRFYDDQLRLTRMANAADSASKTEPTDSDMERAAWIGLARILLNLEEFVARE